MPIFIVLLILSKTFAPSYQKDRRTKDQRLRSEDGCKSRNSIITRCMIEKKKRKKKGQKLGLKYKAAGT
jgi:hypothetical protein